MAVVEVCIFPIGEDVSVSKYVAGCEKVLQNEELEYSLNPMGTCIEGDIDEIFKVVRKMQESVFDKGAKRVYSVLKIDDRRDKKASMAQKLNSVNEKL